MVSRNTTCFTATLACSALVAGAAPDSNAAFTVVNASRVVFVRDASRFANRIMRGPLHGESALIDWADSVEVVDDGGRVAFRPNGKRRLNSSVSDDTSGRDRKIAVRAIRDPSDS